MDWGLLGSSVHGISQAPLSMEFPAVGVDCHFLLQKVFLTKVSNLRLVHWQVDPLPLSHQAVNGFPGDSVVKNPPANAGDTGLIPCPERSHMPWSK